MRWDTVKYTFLALLAFAAFAIASTMEYNELKAAEERRMSVENGR